MRGSLLALRMLVLLCVCWPSVALAQPAPADLDAALCQAQDRLETLRKELEPFGKTKRTSAADMAGATAALRAMAEENLRIRDALYEVATVSWPDEVKRAYVDYFLAPGDTPGLAQRVGAENLVLLRGMLESPLFKDAGWPTKGLAGPDAEFHAFIIVAQGRGADPQWVAQTLTPRLKALAAAGEATPLAAAWLAAGARPDLARFEADFIQAGAPWDRYGKQLKGLAALQQLMPVLGAAARLPALSPAPCGAEKPPSASQLQDKQGQKKMGQGAQPRPKTVKQ